VRKDGAAHGGERRGIEQGARRVRDPRGDDPARRIERHHDIDGAADALLLRERG
jgi:hypothetical protein